jgi:hypothetical protein
VAGEAFLGGQDVRRHGGDTYRSDKNKNPLHGSPPLGM